MLDNDAVSDTSNASRKVEETFFDYKEDDPIIERRKQLQRIRRARRKAQAYSIQ